MAQTEGTEQVATPSPNLALLDSNYKRFPSFVEWVATTSIDQKIWGKKLAAVKNLKALAPDVLKRARDVATRAAAVDTGAIEGLYEVDRGFTYTVAVENGAWEAAVHDKGREFRVMFEAQLRAYEYILDWATSNKPITEALVRTLHQEICRDQQSYTVHTPSGPQEQALPKGVYKTSSNHVLQRDGSSHSYCPVEQTTAEMERYINELRSDEFINGSAPQQAAYSHYAFVSIHPFSDGNGRVARALASVYTYRELSAPLLVLVDNRDDYFDALAQADKGVYQPLVNFIFQRVCDSIELIEESVRTATSRSLSDSLSTLRKIYYTPNGFTHDLIDDAALKIAHQLSKNINDLVQLHSDKHWKVQSRVQRYGGYGEVPFKDYRHLLSGDDRHLCVEVVARSEQPKSTEVKLYYTIMMPEVAGTGEHILVIDESTSKDTLEIPLESCIPNITIATEWRFRMFAERVLANVLAVLCD